MNVRHHKRTQRYSNYNYWKAFLPIKIINFFVKHLEKEIVEVVYTNFELSPVDKLNEQYYSIYLKNLIHKKTQAKLRKYEQ